MLGWGGSLIFLGLCVCVFIAIHRRRKRTSPP
jgi:hypothetical protein